MQWKSKFNWWFATRVGEKTHKYLQGLHLIEMVKCLVLNNKLHETLVNFSAHFFECFLFSEIGCVVNFRSALHAPILLVSISGHSSWLRERKWTDFLQGIKDIGRHGKTTMTCKLHGECKLYAICLSVWLDLIQWTNRWEPILWNFFYQWWNSWIDH